MKSHVMARNHKIIHFVDLKNPKVSLCDPYCVGLLKQHLAGQKGFFYPLAPSFENNQLQTHPSILNRFSLEPQTENLKNFSLVKNGKYVQAENFEGDFIDHFRVIRGAKDPIQVRLTSRFI